jgi:hypothetical protein
LFVIALPPQRSADAEVTETPETTLLATVFMATMAAALNTMLIPILPLR